MTDRQLAVLGAVALGMVLVTVALYSGPTAPRTDFVKGTPLIQGLDTGRVQKILIRRGKKAVTLELTSGGFVVREKDDYPASLKKINDLIVKCLDIRCAAKVTEKKENHKALGVTEDAPDAVVISFFAGDKRLVGLVKGKSAEDSVGVYVRRLGEDTVYRTTEHVWFDDRPIDYIDRTLIDVKKDDIERVEVKTPKGSYTIARDDKKNIVLQGIPKGKKAKKWDVESTFEALTGLDLSDVSPAGKIKLTWDATYTCRLKTHLSYVVQLARKDDKHYVRVSAHFPPDLRITRPTKDEKSEEVKKKAAIWEAANTAPKFTARHKPWVYEISSYDAEKMRKSFEDLIEDEQPDEIAARHILIAYKGAERADKKITRSKEEARKLAEKVLAEAKKKGADFAALARKYSDGPTRDKGGDLGAFKKGKMAPEFDEAAFKLKVGELSGVVETPFGFHIIKRTR